MRLEKAVAALALGLALGLPDGGQASAAPPDLQALFPRRAEVFVEQPGLSRLPLPPEVLAECGPDLADLRLVDRTGREVPYLVDGGPPPDTTLEERVVFEPRLLSAEQQTRLREDAPNLQREAYQLSLPEGEPGAWDLVVDSRLERFVRQVEVTWLRPDGEEVAIWQGSLFRLPGPGQERLEVGLPPLGPGRLAVVLEGEGEPYLAPTFRFVATRRLPEHEQLRVALEVIASRTRGSRTLVELDRPRGLVPDRLAVTTTTGSFSRGFEVWDEGPGMTASRLGAATLFRLEGEAGLERTEVTLAQARGDRLRVVIDDGDSPALEGLAFQAVLRRPSLVFSLPVGGSDAAAGHLLYGGGRVFRPRYDLAGLLPAASRQSTGEEARIEAELRGFGRLGLARLGPPAANPRWDPSPALAFAMRAGTEIATWPYRYRRALSVPETGEGLLRVRLDAATLARSRQDLGDLRLVDSASRQWPYLLDRDAGMQRVALEVGEPESVKDRSIYTLRLPESPLPVRRLVLDTPAAYFDRRYELVARTAEGARELTVGRGRLIRRPEEPAEVVLEIGRRRLSGIELRVQDGDDPPLEWTSVEAEVPRPELYFAAPRGDYALLFGDPEARLPRYELERVRDLVLAVGPTPVAAGELVEKAGRGPLSRFRGEGGWQQVVLWAAIVLATLALAWLTLKLARQESD